MKLENNKALLFILFFAGIFLLYGWRLFWFLTDDAFISFRYISNSLLGYGYVWNPPPFRPVEGYSNFLWILLLDIIWRTFGILPTDSSNYLSLLFSFLILIIGSAMTLQMNWSARLFRYRMIFLILLLVGVITNRTFLAWTSSGLETAMFNFFLTFWVYCCIFIPVLSTRWILLITASATCTYLSRPDGLLFSTATILMLSLAYLKDKRTFGMRHLIAASPLLLILVHLGWRRNTYGEWLPNTYYAKIQGMWPESGIRYAFSFALEYALWIWLALVIFILLTKRASFQKGISESCRGSGEVKNKLGSCSENKALLPTIVVS